MESAANTASSGGRVKVSLLTAGYADDCTTTMARLQHKTQGYSFLASDCVQLQQQQPSSPHQPHISGPKVAPNPTPPPSSHSRSSDEAHLPIVWLGWGNQAHS